MTKRNNGLDLLNIITMFMVLVLHMLLNTGGLEIDYSYGLSFYEVWIFEILCYVAVDCFALSTGYFAYNKMFKAKQIITIWLTTFVISIMWIVVSFLTHNEISLLSLIKCIIPFASGHYWYISTYVLLVLLSPVINKLIASLSKKQHMYTLLTMFITFSIIPTIIAWEDVYKINAGQSFIWFVFLYLLAAYFAKYSEFKRKTTTYFSLYLVFAVILFMAKIVISKISSQVLGYEYGSSVLLKYNSPLVLGGGIALFATFLNLKMNYTLKVRKYTLAVYLVTEHVLGKTIIWNFAQRIIDYSTWYWLPIAMLYCSLVYFLSILIGICVNAIVQRVRFPLILERLEKTVNNTFG